MKGKKERKERKRRTRERERDRQTKTKRRSERARERERETTTSKKTVTAHVLSELTDFSHQDLFEGSFLVLHPPAQGCRNYKHCKGLLPTARWSSYICA